MFNCVGHYNHRYLMLFVVFMWMGTFYVVHCAWSRVFVLLHIDSVSVCVWCVCVCIQVCVYVIVWLASSEILYTSYMSFTYLHIDWGVTKTKMWSQQWNYYN